MKTQTRYSPTHVNSGGVQKGGSLLGRAIAATPRSRGGGRDLLGDAIRATPRELGGGRSRLTDAIAATERQRVVYPKAAPAIPLSGPTKYRVSPKVLRHILGSGNPLSMYRSLLEDTVFQFIGAWASPAGRNRYALEVPGGYTGSCYSYRFLRMPPLDCDPKFGTRFIAQRRVGPFVSDCSTWHYSHQAGLIDPVGSSITLGPRSNALQVFAGPTSGGLYACERLNFEHVWRYQWPTVPEVPRTVRIKQRSYPVPYAIPEPAPLSDPALDGLPSPYGRKRDRKNGPAADPVSRRLTSRAGLRPYETSAFSFRAASGGLRAGPPENHKEVPPGPNKKEKKRKWPLGLIDKYYGPITEGVDLIEAIEDSIGDRRCKGGGRTIQERLKCIYRNWRHVDPYKLGYNLAANELQDRAIGALGNRFKKAVGHAADKGYWRSVRGPSISRFPGYIR